MKLSKDDLIELTAVAEQAAKAAGEFIQSKVLENVDVQFKAGAESEAASIVTEVDIKSQEIILSLLNPTCQQFDLALLTEETPDDGCRHEKDYFWCVDPMDGTLCFAQQRPGYSVSIGLVSRNGDPVIGVVYEPISGKTYSAYCGGGVTINRQPLVSTVGEGLTDFYLDGSFHQHEDFDRIMNVLETEFGPLEVHLGFGAVMNACRVLECEGAIYFKYPKPETGGGSLWDYSATACLFNEADFVASDIYGHPLDLNRKDGTFMNHGGVIYTSSEIVQGKVVALYKGFSR